MVSRAEKWVFVIESLIGGLDDAGILRWLDVFGPDIDRLYERALRLRDGMVAT